jgi:hypothetical protein
VPLVSESVWANAGAAAVQSTISANQTFTCHARIGNQPHLCLAVPDGKQRLTVINIPTASLACTNGTGLREASRAQLALCPRSPHSMPSAVAVRGAVMETREDCLREATECDRLAKLANTQATRTLLAVAAFQWQKLAERAAERQKNHWPFVSEAIRPN